MKGIIWVLISPALCTTVISPLKKSNLIEHEGYYLVGLSNFYLNCKLSLGCVEGNQECTLCRSEVTTWLNVQEKQPNGEDVDAIQ